MQHTRTYRTPRWSRRGPRRGSCVCSPRGRRGPRLGKRTRGCASGPRRPQPARAAARSSPRRARPARCTPSRAPAPRASRREADPRASGARSWGVACAHVARGAHEISRPRRILDQSPTRILPKALAAAARAQSPTTSRRPLSYPRRSRQPLGLRVRRRVVVLFPTQGARGSRSGSESDDESSSSFLPKALAAAARAQSPTRASTVATAPNARTGAPPGTRNVPSTEPAPVPCFGERMGGSVVHVSVRGS
jgi:hypothetical protein